MAECRRGPAKLKEKRTKLAGEKKTWLSLVAETGKLHRRGLRSIDRQIDIYICRQPRVLAIQRMYSR